MSFGFGNNNNTNNTFGGFGSSNTGGFGSNNASSGGSLFGGNTATSGGFTGFGANNANNNNNNSSPFGAPKPAFGAPATSGGGGLFGNNTSTTSGFGASAGGFGSTGSTAGFGSSTGGLFGQPKPATGGFGSTNTGGSLFGGGASTGGFGATNNNSTSNPFSANTGSTFGANTNNASSSGGFTFGGSATTNTANNSGTANTPFTAFSEKESTGNSTSLYQSITFQAPYQNKSFEELRNEDYAQGRRFGNSNGQAGSFGQSTGFGGFGNTNTTTTGGLFGAGANTSGTGAFGASNNNTATNSFGGFGSSNSGTLFGNKPQTGGLFGQQSSGTTAGGFGGTANASGGLFGNTNNTNTGFGASNNTSTGLFGSTNNQQASKPAFGGFGASNNTGGFGSTTNSSGGLFGSTTNNTASQGGSLFGQNNQQQSSPFGSTNNTTGGGLFGNANKPAGGGLFGSTTNTAASGGLFGAQPHAQQSNPFGQSTNTSSGLFGNLNQNQNKPAGTSLFGSTNNTGTSAFGAQNNQNSGGSLFGNNNNSGGSLFGNNNKPAGTSLFGASTNNANAGTSLFGASQQNQSNNGGGSLFGGLGQNQQTSNSNSLFGGSLNQSQPAQNQLHASLTGSPYGNEQLFSSLAAPSPPVGPLATPLSGAKPAVRKTPSLLASARVNTPVYTPRGGSLGRNGGYGFSYSTYGTPASPYTSGSLTPGASSLLKPTGSLSSALTSRLNKSFSTSNLRADPTTSEGRSLLRPGAFSPQGTPGHYSNGNVRKLKIDRSLRTDLFGPESQTVEAARDNESTTLKKRVSFDKSTEKEATGTDTTASKALVRMESADTPDSPDNARAGQSNGPEQVSSALTTVPEDRPVGRASSANDSKTSTSKVTVRSEVGSYWTKPALKDLKNMSRQQLKNVGNFVVGREGVGRIEFGTVDLTNTPLEDICGNVVQLNPRSATVYQDDSNKPAMGKALNVPSTIYLENSWPRSPGLKSGREYEKHIARLKRVSGTHFLTYDADTGVWSFKVDHFTTYGLPDDTDESELPNHSQNVDASSPLSDLPETIAQEEGAMKSSVAMDGEDMEDTFQFKLDRRSQLSIPGGFGLSSTFSGHNEAFSDDHLNGEEQIMEGGPGDMAMDDPSLLSSGPVQAPSPGAFARYHASVMEDVQGKEDILQLPGSFLEGPKELRPILKPAAGKIGNALPEQLSTAGWEEQLNRTMSPRKRDRQALRDTQQSLMHTKYDDVIDSPFKHSVLGQSALGQSYLSQKSAKKAGSVRNVGSKQDPGKSQAFQTAMDLMDSMYPSDKTGKNAVTGLKGFEYPNPRKPRQASHDDSSETAWHNTVKPKFSNNATLVYSVPASWPQPSGMMLPAMQPVIGEQRDVRFARFTAVCDDSAPALLAQKKATKIVVSTGVPMAQTPSTAAFASLASACDSGPVGASQEKTLWKLCSILHDGLDIACTPYFDGVPDEQVQQLEARIRMDTFGIFWSELMTTSIQDRIARAQAAEERALLQLTANDIGAACKTLVEAKDFNLAVLVSQLPGSEQSRLMMKRQIEVWRDRNDWSEMSDSVRALYSLLAGELCVVEGNSGAAEDRASTFSISERFDLTWQQSLALRIYFGGFQSMSQAIASYTEDISSGRERTRHCTYDGEGTETQDILMQVLYLYAGTQDEHSLFNPRAASGNALDWRVTWQLASLLCAKKLCDLSRSELDQITYALATQFEASGNVTSGTWVLLHLHDSTARGQAISSFLERHGDVISTPAEGQRGSFEQLTEDNQIPEALVWRSKAVYAKGGLEQPSLQAEWLLRAGDVDAAHAVLCSTIGPKAIIEQDYTFLSNFLQQLQGRRTKGWEHGGQVFLDYLTLLRAHSGQRRIPDEEACSRRLNRGLAAMAEAIAGKSTLEELVALTQMEKMSEQQAIGEQENGVGEWMVGSRPEADMLRKYRQAMAV